MTLLLLLGAAFAGTPQWAGIPLAALPGLSLSAPDLSRSASSWQAADTTGGWVRLHWFADDTSAAANFQLQAQAASSMTQPVITIAGADEARGAADFVVLRSKNVVLVLRATGAAQVRAKALLAALRAEGTAATIPADVDPAVWDAFGRRLVEQR